MPRYDYLCKSCGQSFEVQQSFHDEPLTVCEKCGGELRKVFGSVGISFKGSGFYRNDSRSSSSSYRSSSTNGHSHSTTPAASDAGTSGSSSDSASSSGVSSPAAS